jgi:hypothetical protein
MKWIKYKTVCAELSFAIATLDRMVAAFIWNLYYLLYLLCSWIVNFNIQKMHDQR